LREPRLEELEQRLRGVAGRHEVARGDGELECALHRGERERGEVANPAGGERVATLAREAIFGSPPFRERYEPRARENLARELAALRAG
jgi:hypothetical protein